MTDFAVVKVAAAIALVLLAAGCGGARSGSATPAAFGSCTVYDHSGAAYIKASGYGAGAACSSIVRQSGAHAFWSRFASSSYSGDERVCVMQRDGLRLSIYDSHWLSEGDAICGRLTARGWIQTG